MPTTADSLTAIRDAIDGLGVAARQDDDEPRARTAHWLTSLFDGVKSQEDLAAAVTEANRVFRGGMGSFTDVGTEVMHQAVERLRTALRRS